MVNWQLYDRLDSRAIPVTLAWKSQFYIACNGSRFVGVTIDKEQEMKHFRRMLGKYNVIQQLQLSWEFLD